MPVKKGLATWAGLVAAVGQYAAAVAVFLAAPDPNVALGPLATATVTLYGVVKGRMDQATAHAARTPAPPVTFSSSTGTTSPFQSNAVADLLSGQIIGRGGVTSADELGDADALPDYRTETDPPADEGDTSANGDTGSRET